MTGTETYGEATAQLRAFLVASGYPLDVTEFGRREVEEFLLSVGERCGAGTVSNRSASSEISQKGTLDSRKVRWPGATFPGPRFRLLRRSYSRPASLCIGKRLDD